MTDLLLFWLCICYHSYQNGSRSSLKLIASCEKEELGHVLELRKREARATSDADNQASSVELFNRLQWLPFYRLQWLPFYRLQWLPFYKESKIAKCCVAHKRIEGEVPLYNEGSLILNRQQHNRATGYSNTNFICPKFNRKTEGGRSFAVPTCELWNSLRPELRNCVLLQSFKNNYRNNFFDVQQRLHYFIV